MVRDFTCVMEFDVLITQITVPDRSADRKLMKNFTDIHEAIL